MNTMLLQYYRRQRAHQRNVWITGGMLTTYPDGRTELSYASAPYGEHALSAITAARATVHFMKRLESYV